MGKGFRIAEIAERVALSGDDLEDVARVAEQCRYWTREGVLTPVTPKHSGSGRWRRYSTEQVYITAILAELARIGMNIGGMKRVVGWLSLKDIDDPLGDRITAGDEDASELWSAAINGKRNIFLIIWCSFEDKPWRILLTRERRHLTDITIVDYSTAIVLNLERIIRRVGL